MSETPPILLQDLPFLHGLVQLAVVRLGHQAVTDGLDDVQGHERVRGSLPIGGYGLRFDRGAENLQGQLVLGRRLLLNSDLCSVCQLHEFLSVDALLVVPAADTAAQVGTKDFCLVTLAIVLEAARPFAVASLIVVPVASSFADLGVEGVRIPLHAGLDGSRPVLLVLQVVGAVAAVTVLAELAVCKTLAV